MSPYPELRVKETKPKKKTHRNHYDTLLPLKNLFNHEKQLFIMR